jgi:hypothetical protein
MLMPVSYQTSLSNMLIYNVTMKVDWSVHEAWLQWMVDKRIPQILDTGCFVKHQLLRIMGTDDSEGPTYALQLYAETREDYHQYSELYERALNRATHDLWRDDVLAFATLMEVVH